jgi:hypothetical protein
MPSRAIWLISGSGLVPFLVCLGLIYGVPSQRAAAIQAFVAYSALTLTFLGGARWGAELVRAPDGPALGRMMAAAIPSVVGLFALLPQVPARLAIGVLLASSAWQLTWDVAAARAGLLPAWNGRVRTVMTVLGTLCTVGVLPVVWG